MSYYSYLAKHQWAKTVKRINTEVGNRKEKNTIIYFLKKLLINLIQSINLNLEKEIKEKQRTIFSNRNED